MEESYVVPVPKTKPAIWDKLRPISMTDLFARVYTEGFVTTWLLDETQSKIDPNQYGNRKRRTTW